LLVANASMVISEEQRQSRGTFSLGLDGRLDETHRCCQSLFVSGLRLRTQRSASSSTNAEVAPNKLRLEQCSRRMLGEAANGGPNRQWRPPTPASRADVPLADIRGLRFQDI
jgi:hypothetical protein